MATPSSTIIPLLIAVLLNNKWRGSTFFRTPCSFRSSSRWSSAGALEMIYDANFGVLTAS